VPRAIAAMSSSNPSTRKAPTPPHNSYVRLRSHGCGARQPPVTAQGCQQKCTPVIHPTTKPADMLGWKVSSRKLQPTPTATARISCEAACNLQEMYCQLYRTNAAEMSGGRHRSGEQGLLETKGTHVLTQRTHTDKRPAEGSGPRLRRASHGHHAGTRSLQDVWKLVDVWQPRGCVATAGTVRSCPRRDCLQPTCPHRRTRLPMPFTAKTLSTG
jgi:hypothetical protein